MSESSSCENEWERVKGWCEAMNEINTIIYLVGGMISTTSKKNTWRLIRIDIDNVTYGGKR